MVRLASSGVTSPCRAVIFFWLQKTQSLGQPLWEMKIGMIACFFKLKCLLNYRAYVGERLVFKINQSEAALADEISDGTEIRMS